MALNCFWAYPATAQQVPIDPWDNEKEVASDQNEGLERQGQTSETGSGQVGRRQSLSDAAPNIRPLDRVDTRINNRVQNRIRNRIDKDFGGQGTSSFEEASDQIRHAGRLTSQH